MATYTEHLPSRAIRSDKTLIFSAGLGVITLTIYLWAFVNDLSNLVEVLGLASIGAMLLIPLIVAYSAVKLTLEENKTSTSSHPIQHYVRLNLRRCAFLLAADALVFIPIIVIFTLHLVLLFASIVQHDNFPRLPTTYFQEALIGLGIGLGLWGMNLLACVVGAALAIRWQRMSAAFVGSVIVLIITIIVGYEMISMIGATIRVILVVVAGLLPYLLAAGILFLLDRQRRNQNLEYSESQQQR